MGGLDYVHVDVFADGPFCGNSLPVFVGDTVLTAGQMLQITRELRHFEAIFVRPGREAGQVRARIFDLIEELPFAGHPILGAAAVLQHRADPGRRGTWTFDLSGRLVTAVVEPTAAGYSALLDQGAPQFLGVVETRSEIAEAFGLTGADLEPDLPIEVASTGLRYCVVPLRPGRIGAARIGADITGLLRGHGAQFAVLLDGTALEQRHWNNDGVVEDVATGSAAGVVGAYCVEHGLAQAGEPFALSQGRFAGRPSRLSVEVDRADGTIASVKVGGGVAFVGRGALDALPEPQP